MDNKSLNLKRTFGMREAITITVGTVIGVGLFTTGGNVVGILGSSVILATFIAMLISIYPALLYAEMGSALPYAGGTYQYASLGLGKPFGVLAGWNFIISLIAVTSGESLAFSFYFKTIFRALGYELPISDVALACLVIFIFIITNTMGVEMTGRLQNGFMFFFWGVALIWFLLMIPNANMPNFLIMPEFLKDVNLSSFISSVAMIWWCFAGFETCCALGEEIKYPHINIPRALFLAPFIVFIVNAFFQWFLVAIVPLEKMSAIAEASAPYAEAMTSAGILGLPLILLAMGIAFGGDFSTLNASIAVPPRYLFTMARDGSMPKVFSKIHPKYQTPYISIISLGFLSIFLVASNSLIYIASLSLFADLFYYVIGIAAAFGLRKNYPELKRHYKAPGVKIGVPVSMAIYCLMIFYLDSSAVITGIVWSLLGLLIYYYCKKKYKSEIHHPDYINVSVEEPSPEEVIKMDKEYKIWKNIVAILSIAAILIYILPMLLK
ncbi:APC family permease [Peptoniphilus catoniae]|uniref:APC family permease n=1 Tax=Peptoniphilus catoniae TaxID=1660341 RepID=UPI001C5761B3|nr:amino acid permease [Peptoniphilus catoniae]